MWRLVYAQETNAAIRAAKRLPGRIPEGRRRGAEADARRRPARTSSYAALPSAMRESLGMKYALARYYRKNESYAKARAILAEVPGDAAKMGDAEAWWIERRIVARHSIGIETSRQRARPPTRLPAPMASARARRRSRASSSPAGSRCAT